MLDYVQPIYIALIVFLIISVLIFIPWLIYIYRKYGYFPFSTTIIVFSFIFYFMAAFFLTLLPLPETRHNCTGLVKEVAYSLTPFQFVDDIMRESQVNWSNPSTYSYLLKERAFLQAFFNFLLLMPLGVYLRYYFGRRRAWWKATLLICCVTLFFEVTQLTGIYGIYDCPYRLFDVDDLMLNATGGLVGFFLAPIVLALFPGREKVREKAELLAARDEVRNMAVLLAMAIDLSVVHIVVWITATLTGYHDMWSQFILHTLTLILWMFIIPAIRNGRTFGTGVLRFRYTSEKLTSGLFKRTIAVWLVYALYFSSYLISQFDISEPDVPTIVPQSMFRLWNQLGFWSSGLLTLIIFIHVLIVLLSREKRHFFFDTSSDLSTTRRMREKA